MAEPIETPPSEESSITVSAPRISSAHPIGKAIDTLTHRTLDIREAVRNFIPLATKVQKKRLERVAAEVTGAIADLPKTSTLEGVAALKTIQNALFKIERLKSSELPQILETSLFLGLFSSFDAFIGDLLRAVFNLRPELFQSLNRTLEFSEILSADSIESLKLRILEDEIETLRRKSYSEQFASLTNRFSVKLTSFERWPDFVEASQRRNLLTHCDGLVSEQYVLACKAAGVKESALPTVGSKIMLGRKYFISTCEMVAEVAVKSGQTLWRKTLPDQSEAADEHIRMVLYKALQARCWNRARIIGEFASSLRNMSDQAQKIIVVNYSQALKRSGRRTEGIALANKVDWTASTNDFKLAHAVLTEDFGAAALLMHRIGKEGDLVKEHSYHTWPLFLEFRESSEFLTAYETIYGYPYAAKLKEDAARASKQTADVSELQGVKVHTSVN